MQQDLAVLRDVELRLRALEEARRLRAELEAVLQQLRTAKRQAAEAPDGSPLEQQSLREAAEASQRFNALQGALARTEQELRRTHYLLKVLSE